MPKRPKHLPNLHYSTFTFIIFFDDSEWNQLGIYVFFKTFTADGKYSLRNNESLPQPIEMQLSKNLNTFYQYLPKLMQSTSKYKHFERQR